LLGVLGGGTTMIIKEALTKFGKDIEIKEIVISLQGEKI